MNKEQIENRRQFLRGITKPDTWVDELCDQALLNQPDDDWPDDCLVNIDILFGHIEIETRMVPIENGLAGEGRTRTYDGEGKLTKDTGWQRTGCKLIWPEPEPRRWWEFWK